MSAAIPASTSPGPQETSVVRPDRLAPPPILELTNLGLWEMLAAILDVTSPERPETDEGEHS
jgi:hypothetical protein